jgi:quercetin dioxygenase-like cupin family protein
LIAFLFPKQASPPRHTHPQDESYIVIEGHLTVHAGGHRFDLQTGGAATVPMGVPPHIRVDSETARVLVLSTPPGSNGSCATAGFQQPLPPCPR